MRRGRNWSCYVYTGKNPVPSFFTGNITGNFAGTFPSYFKNDGNRAAVLPFPHGDHNVVRTFCFAMTSYTATHGATPGIRRAFYMPMLVCPDRIDPGSPSPPPPPSQILTNNNLESPLSFQHVPTAQPSSPLLDKNVLLFALFCEPTLDLPNLPDVLRA